MICFPCDGWRKKPFLHEKCSYGDIHVPNGTANGSPRALTLASGTANADKLWTRDRIWTRRAKQNLCSFIGIWIGWEHSWMPKTTQKIELRDRWWAEIERGCKTIQNKRENKHTHTQESLLFVCVQTKRENWVEPKRTKKASVVLKRNEKLPKRERQNPNPKEKTE